MKNKAYTPKNRVLYYIMKPVLTVLLPVFYSVKCYGKENLPKEGKLILASNHISIVDPVMLLVKLPRVIHFMAKSEIFKRPFLNWFFRNMNAFPVNRGKSDTNALSYAISVLENPWVFGIFPEGGTSDDRLPKRAKSGVAYIARTTKADVLPVSIYMTPGKRTLRPKVTIRIGKVIKNGELGFTGEEKTRELKDASRLIMDRIVAMWDKKHERE